MNENVQTLQLSIYLTAREGWGRQAGAAVRQKLEASINARPGLGLLRLSMQNVKRVDVAFASEAIVGLIERHRGLVPMCLTNLADTDLIENVAAAAERMNVPVTTWNNRGVEMLGLTPAASVRDALAFALARPQGIRAAEYAKATGVSIANASSRFKQLWEQGFLRRAAGSARSGGAEFVYRPIG